MLMEDDMAVDDAPEDEADDAPRSSYNFAPGYHGIVYRADASSSVSRHHDGQEMSREKSPPPPVKYKLQSMKWGLVPSWTKRNPDYRSMLKTINCRSDSLGTPGGLWASMKARKRCVVVAQGFFEWLKVGPKEKTPHFTKREDSKLMCFAGLWDCVQYEGVMLSCYRIVAFLGDGSADAGAGSDEKHYTYTIITTDSNAQLKFLHDRMPVILKPDDVKMWLDPSRYEWSRELQALLKPYDGKVCVYPVVKDVGKVGNNSPSFVIPLDSNENKSNIANMFARGAKKEGGKGEGGKGVEGEDGGKVTGKEGIEAPVDAAAGKKRKVEHVSEVSRKRRETGKISATENCSRGKGKATPGQGQKITQFFARE